MLVKVGTFPPILGVNIENILKTTSFTKKHLEEMKAGKHLPPTNATGSPQEIAGLVKGLLRDYGG